MVTGDVISSRGWIMKYTDIPLRIKRELVIFVVDYDWQGYIVGIVVVGIVTIHSSGQTIFSFTHIESISLVTVEEVDEIAGGARSMSMNRIGEVDDGAGFTVMSLVRVRAGYGAWRPGSRLVLIRS